MGDELVVLLSLVLVECEGRGVRTDGSTNANGLEYVYEAGEVGDAIVKRLDGVFEEFE